jgi:hypothetical protein
MDDDGIDESAVEEMTAYYSEAMKLHDSKFHCELVYAVLQSLVLLDPDSDARLRFVAESARDLCLDAHNTIGMTEIH